MAGTMKTEPDAPSKLTTSREPIGATVPGQKGSTGDRALLDAITMVLIAWAVVFFLVFSLRKHNV